MAVITIAARISTTPAIAPPTSAAMLTEGCATEVGVGKEYICLLKRLCSGSLVPRPRTPPGGKRSGEQSRISWAYYPKGVIINEIARLVIITYTFLTMVKFAHLHSNIRTFFERAGRNMF